MVMAAVDISPSAYDVREGVSTLLGMFYTSGTERQTGFVDELDTNEQWNLNTARTTVPAQKLIKTTTNSNTVSAIANPLLRQRNNHTELVSSRKNSHNYDHLESNDDSLQNGSKTNRIAFGSCNEQDLTNRLWNIIQARKPSAFIWGGDAIYADHNLPKDSSQLVNEQQCATPERIRQLYKKQLNNVEYRSLLEQNITVFGTFDDHDFGCDNGDSTNIHRQESGVAFVDFLGLPDNSPTRIRAQQGLGVYGVKLFDFGTDGRGSYDVPDTIAGIDADLLNGDDESIDNNSSTSTLSYSNHSVAVFVLDVRTNKSPWKQDLGRFAPDYDGDFLGQRQWEWFTKSIRRSKASVNVIVSGLQFHGTRAPDVNIAEAWGNYPRMQQRLYDLLLSENVQSPILISGDVHMTQLSRKDCILRGTSSDRPSEETNRNRGRRRSLIELTTSGMTHSWGSLSEKQIPTTEPYFYPIQSVVNAFDWARMKVVAIYVHSLHRFCPWTDIVISNNGAEFVDDTTIDAQPTTATRTHNNHQQALLSSHLFENGGGDNSVTQGMQYSLEMNFGELEFDWNERTVAIRSIGHTSGADSPLIMARYSFDQLSGQQELSNHYPNLESDFVYEEAHRLASNIEGDWVCINHRGRDRPVGHLIGHFAAASVLITLAVSPSLLFILLLLILKRKTSIAKFRSQC